MINEEFASDQALHLKVIAIIAGLEVTATQSDRTGSSQFRKAKNETGKNDRWFWLLVENRNKCFSDRKRFSCMLAESPNFQELR